MDIDFLHFDANVWIVYKVKVEGLTIRTKRIDSDVVGGNKIVRKSVCTATDGKSGTGRGKQNFILFYEPYKDMGVIIHHRCSVVITDIAVTLQTWSVRRRTDGGAFRRLARSPPPRHSGRLVGRRVGGGTRLIDDDRPGAALGQWCIPLIRVDDRVR